MEQNTLTGTARMDTVQETDLAHLAGFFDAVGTITVDVTVDDDYKTGYHLRPALRLSRPLEGNDMMMGKITEYCEQQAVQYSLYETEEAYQWVCRKSQDIRRFLEPLLDHLVYRFESAIILLEQILPRFEDDLHTTKDGIYEIMGYVDELAKHNRTDSLKYDQEYFAEEWSITE